MNTEGKFKTGKSIFPALAVFLLIVLIAGAGGRLVFDRFEQGAKAQATNSLTSTGKLRARDLSAFLKERKGDARVAAEFLGAGLVQTWWQGGDKELPAMLRRTLNSTMAEYGYTGAMILDISGDVRFSLGRSVGMSAAGKVLALRALGNPLPVLCDLYFADPAAPKKLMLDTFAPIMGTDGTKAVGILVLRGDWDHLFSTFQPWPEDSGSAEYLLVRKDGADVLFLNRLRHQEPIADRLRAPLTADMRSPAWPAIRAVQGHYGALETVDYRGKAVLAYTLPVADTDWSMVVKEDVTEALDRVRRIEMGASFSFLAAAALAFALWWSWLRSRRHAEQALRESRERFEKAFQASPDSITLVRLDNGAFVEVNDSFERFTGYSRAEAMGRNARDLKLWMDPVQREFLYAELRAGRPVSGLEARIRRKDGAMRIGLRFATRVEISGVAHVLSIMRDITEARRAEQALQRERDFAAGLIAAAPTIIVMLDLEGRISHVNPYFEKLAGCRLDEVRGKDWFETFLPERERERVRALFQSAVQGVPTRGNINPVVTRSGEEREIEWHDQTVRDEQGNVAALLAIGQDVTERRRVEDALRASEERLNEAQRIARVGNWELDLASGRLSWSDEIFRIFEIDKAKFGATYEAFLSAIHPGDRDLVNAAYTDSLKTRKPYDITHRLRMADGRIKYVHERCESKFDVEGKPLSSIGTVQDITERKLADEALAESHRLLQTIINTVPVRIFWKDRELRYLGCNLAFAKDAGEVHPDDLIGKDDYQLGWKAQAEIYRADDRQTIDSGIPKLFYEEPQTTPDGHEIWLRTSKVPLRDRENEIIGVLGVYEDITGHKRVHEALKELNAELEQRVRERTAKLQLANQELETFTYTVAHDLKGPLRGIDGYSRLLLADYSDKLDGEGRQFLQKVRQAAQQMGELISDLLAYSRLERRDFHTGEVDPRELIEALLAERADEIKARGVAVSIDVACTRVTADRDGLAMALRNLLENALKFTRDTPQPVLEICARDIGAMCILSVRDNGPGFDMKYHDRIFDIFQRLHRSEDYPGTGIGLAIVKKAMERMGGRAWAESEPGKGATFYLEIPE